MFEKMTECMCMREQERFRRERREEREVRGDERWEESF
jgi:hypothetical protein